MRRNDESSSTRRHGSYRFCFGDDVKDLPSNVREDFPVGVDGIPLRDEIELELPLLL